MTKWDKIHIRLGKKVLKEGVEKIVRESIVSKSMAEYLYITKIEATANADAYFPRFDETEYGVSILGENEDNNIKYKFCKYTKK